MSIWSRFSRVFTVDDTILDEQFSLTPDTDQADDPPLETSHDKQDSKNSEEHKAEQEDGQPEPPKAKTGKGAFVKPKKIGVHQLDEEPPQPAGDDEKQDASQPTQEQDKQSQYESDNVANMLPVKTEKEKARPEKLSEHLRDNRKWLEVTFHLPQNADVIIREFTISLAKPITAYAVFMEGLADKTIINSVVLQPLMVFADQPPPCEAPLDRFDLIKERLVPGNQVMEYEKWDDVIQNILSGSTVLFIEGAAKALAVETKGWEHRSVADTKTETVVRGPHDAFTENLRTNTGLVRSRLRTEKLMTEMLQVGELAPTDVAVMYVDGICNPKLVLEVKRRIKAIKVGFLQDGGILEQYIEDPPQSLIPKMMSTERPDKVAFSLTEGFVAIFVGHSSQALIAPTTFWSLLQTAEDAYLRYPFGTLLRLLRLGAFLTALLLPALFISITNFHPEMIPTDLMLSIAGARERVPFPKVVEVLLMEVAIELIREAGIRIPNVIGPTIGIVGALILGQAAVQAGIVSPLLVIVIAVTALASFTLPNYNMSFAVRTLRFVYIIIGSIWGFYGITLGFLVLVMHWAVSTSFGVPMFSPIAPHRLSSVDVILRGPVYTQEFRPQSLWPQKLRRQQEYNRPWDPSVHDSEEARLHDKKQAEQVNELVRDAESAVKREIQAQQEGEQDD